MQVPARLTMDNLSQEPTTISDRLAGKSTVEYAPMKIQKDFVMGNQSRLQGYFPASFFRRTGRLILDDTGYHYRVRRGTTIGPFPTEKEANQDLNGYIKGLATDKSFATLQN